MLPKSSCFVNKTVTTYLTREAKKLLKKEEKRKATLEPTTDAADPSQIAA
jgi:hypothetical protein